jgi:hypothetical protein
MRLALEALKLFIHSLPSGSYFNIVSFGSNFRMMYPVSSKLDDESLEAALKDIASFDANMGGTEIL